MQEPTALVHNSDRGRELAWPRSPSCPKTQTNSRPAIPKTCKQALLHTSVATSAGAPSKRPGSAGCGPCRAMRGRLRVLHHLLQPAPWASAGEPSGAAADGDTRTRLLDDSQSVQILRNNTQNPRSTFESRGRFTERRTASCCRGMGRDHRRRGHGCRPH